MDKELPDTESDMELDRLSQKSPVPTEDVSNENVEGVKQELREKENDKLYKRPRENEDEGYNGVWQKVENCKKHKAAKTELFISSSEKLPKQFGIAKLFTSLGLRNINKVKYLNHYKVKLEVPDEDYAKKVIECEEFHKRQWKVQRVTEVAMSYGIIRGVDPDLSDSDILQNISGPSDVQIVSAKRLQMRDENYKWVPSEVAQVVFSGSQLPSHVYIENLRVKVEPFIFPATQCSKCWKFGHAKARCSARSVVCPKCGGSHENCEVQIFKCVNCKGDHMALNRSCPVFLREKKLRELMADFNCTYRVACNMYVEPERLNAIPNINKPPENIFHLNTQNSFTGLVQEETHVYAPMIPSLAQLFSPKRPKSPPGTRPSHRNAGSSVSKNKQPQHDFPAPAPAADHIPESPADKDDTDQRTCSGLHECNDKQKMAATDAVTGFSQGVKVMGAAWQVSCRVANVLTSNTFIVMIMSLELLAWASGAAALANCPPGCDCNDDTLVVVCEESRLDVLPIALNPSIQRLIITNNKIKTIDSSMQFYAELQYLDLSHNHLVNIPPKSFSYQRKLQELHLNHNKLSFVNDSTFQGLNALTVLNLNRNFLEELVNGAFSTLPALEELNLGQNRISRIEPKAFAGLSALRILYLDDNQLSSVPTGSFSLLGSLAELHVGLNAFSVLPDDTFAGLNRLTVLDLNGAGLFNISDNAFRGLPGLRTLNLFDNRLNVVPTQQIGGLTRLEELYIGQNDFVALESLSFKGLKNLKLLDITSAAQLERVEKDAFKDNINLETIVLAKNKKLAVLEEGTLLGLPKLKHVTLKDNAIMTISEAVVGKELRQLDITDNPIVCDCQLLWLHGLLNERSNLTQIQCSAPEHLKDKYLRSVTADGLGCAVHDTRQQTIICVVVVACVATLASLVLVLYRYRKSMHEKLKDYKWNKRAMRKDLEYHKPISTEEDCIVRGIHPAQYPAPHAPGLRPIPVTEL